MPTEIETAVLSMLSAIEVPDNADELIEALGPEGVNVVCEAALGTYAGLREKIRTNAAAVVGKMGAQQARETLALLVTDPNEDVAVRALRAVRRRDDAELFERAVLVLRRRDASSRLVAEAVETLAVAPEGAPARDALSDYRANTGEDAAGHRRSARVQQVLDTSAEDGDR